MAKTPFNLEQLVALQQRLALRVAVFEVVTRVSATEYDMRIVFDRKIGGSHMSIADLQSEACTLSNFALATDRMSATFRVTWTATPQRPSSFLVKVRESDSLLIADSTLDQVVSPYGSISYPSNLTFPVGQSKTSTPTVAGGIPTLWSYDPTGLPPGLSFNSATGAISGTATTETAQSKTITASNSAGSVSGSFTIGSLPPLVAVTQNVVFETGGFRNYNAGGEDEFRPTLLQLTFSHPIKLSDTFYSKLITFGVPYLGVDTSNGKVLRTRSFSTDNMGFLASGIHSSIASMIGVLPQYGVTGERANTILGYYVHEALRLVPGQYYTQITIVIAIDNYEDYLITHRLLEGFGVDQYGRPTAQTNQVNGYYMGREP